MSRRVSPEREKQITDNVDELVARMWDASNHKDELLRIMLVEYWCGFMDDYSGYIDMSSCDGHIECLCQEYGFNYQKDFASDKLQTDTNLAKIKEDTEYFELVKEQTRNLEEEK